MEYTIINKLADNELSKDLQVSQTEEMNENADGNDISTPLLDPVDISTPLLLISRRHILLYVKL